MRHVSETSKRAQLGFWLYLMTDCMLFASLFAVYAVLTPATAGGPGPKDIFKLPLVLLSTLILLTSSLSCGLAVVALRYRALTLSVILLGVTYLLGAAFLFIELKEFAGLIQEGYDWQRSAFLSAFFVLVATHGAHVLAGLIWMMVLITRLVLHGATAHSYRQTILFGLFWHFIDVVWIFVFSIVYLMGVAA